MQNVKWIKKEVSLDKAQDLSKSLGISFFTAQLLINRGIDTPESAEKFLRIPSKLVMQSWDKKTSESIGKRLLEAIEKQELITVHGDYDVDGVTGAAVLSLFLKSKGANFNYYLPDRFGDGYGLSSNTIKRLAENNTKILITADCGISNHNEIDLAKELGIEVIVTDHHTIPETLPNADYIFHPALSEDKSFHILSGVGTAFQLAYDIDEMIPSVNSVKVDDYVDLVTIGTIADISPLKGINRQLVQYGLIKMRHNTKLGLETMMEKIGIKQHVVTAEDISFKLVPRLNAAGRMNKAVIALELLLADTEEEAKSITERLESLNKERQELCEKTLLEVEELIEQEVDLAKDKAIVVAKEGFHHGVIGIICSRILEKYNRPVFIMAKEGDMTRGSARSKNMNLVEALGYASDVLSKFGGHNNAAGWSLKTELFEKFRELILDYANKNLSKDQLEPKIDIELELVPEQINYSFFREIQELSPFGLGNPQPIIALKNCKVVEQNSGKEGKHLYLQIEKGNKTIKANYWRAGHLYPVEEKVDIIFDLFENTWNNKNSLQLKINHLKSSNIIKKINFKDLKEDTLQLKFSLDKMIENKSTSAYITSIKSDFLVKVVDDDISNQITIKNLTEIELEKSLESLLKEFGSDNVFLFSLKKNDLLKSFELYKGQNETKVLALLDLPNTKKEFNFLSKLLGVNEFYILQNDYSNKTKINSKVLRDLLKILYLNTNQNEFMALCENELKLDGKLLSIALNILMDLNLIIKDNGSYLLSLNHENIIMTESMSYKNYLEEIKLGDDN